MSNEKESQQTNVESVPYIVIESQAVRFERIIKRYWILCLVLIVLLVGSNIGWLVYESQFETVSTETTTIDAHQDGSGVNIVGGGDVDYGAESPNYTNENNHPQT